MARIFRSTTRAPRGSLQEQIEKATNELLSAPDWPTTMEICDVVNMDPSKARDVCKALKKRLQNKNPRVQWFTLTVVESSILLEMVKIGKKKGGDLQVRDHCLGLLDTWHEAFGGEQGRIRDYYTAYEELRRAGVIFPQRSASQSVPIFTPPATHGFQQQNAPLPSYSSPGYGTPGALQGGTGTDRGGMTMADLANARSSAEVLAEMLQASREGPADDVVTELVEQCQTNQSRVMALIDTTPDEELLRQGLALNDELQKVLAKYNGGAEGEAGEEGEEEEEVATIPPPPPPAELARFDEEGPEEEDDFGALARRSTATEGLQQATQSAPPPPVAGVGPLEDLMGSNDLQSLLTAPHPPPPPPPQLPQSPQPPQSLQPLYYQPPPPPQQYEMQPYQQQYQSPPQYPPPNMQYYQQPYQAPPPPYQSPQTASPGSNPPFSNPPSQFGLPPPPPQFAQTTAALNPFDDETAFSATPEPPYPVNTGYVAPWAVAGGGAYAYGNQIEGGGQPPMSPQQQALLYSNSTPPPAPPPIQETSLQALPPPTLSYSPPALTAPPTGPYSAPDARRASYPLDASSSLAMAATLSLNGGRTPGAAARPAVSQSMAPTPSNQGLTPQQLAKNVDPMDTLFGDLVDMGRARGGLNAGRGGASSAPQGTSLAASKMGST